jgi:polynucleotide 5'-hydroxyl-kinase GRC3/NOL9
MQTMAYFHQKPSITTPTKWISKPINSIRPWIVAYAGEEPGVTAILNYSQAPHPDFLGEVLDGSVVAIVVIDDSLVDPDSIQHTTAETLPYLPPKDNTGYTPPLNPRRSHCVGLALVRGIDVETHALQLVTPLRESAIAEEVMDKQIILVRGGFDSPEWAYLEDLYANPDGGGDVGVERPWVSRREQVGIEHSVWRLRHPPMAKDVR